MALVDYNLFSKFLFLTRVKKRPNLVEAYRADVAEALRRLGPGIDGTTKAEEEFMELGPISKNYAIQTGNLDPLKTWVNAYSTYLKLVTMKTQNNRNMIKIIEEKVEKIKNLEASVSVNLESEDGNSSRAREEESVDVLNG